MTITNLPKSQLARSQYGLTLVELLIGATLGLLMLGGIALMFSQTSKNMHQNEQTTYMQDQARFAMQLLSRDLKMAGYLGGQYGSSEVTIDASVPGSVADADSCTPAGDDTFDLGTRIQFRDETSATTIDATFPCIAAADYQAGTDAILIRRTSGTTIVNAPAGTTEVTLAPNNYYLQTNQTVGTLFKQNGDSTKTLSALQTPFPAPMEFYKYNVRLYYIQPYWETVGDGIPSLCRYELNHAATAAMTKECLAQGIEDLQIIWRTDVQNSPNIGYTSTPSTANLPDIDTARIYLLARSVEADGSYTDTKSYTVGNKDPFTPAADDNFYRRLYSTTVAIKNSDPQ